MSSLLLASYWGWRPVRGIAERVWWDGCSTGIVIGLFAGALILHLLTRPR